MEEAEAERLLQRLADAQAAIAAELEEAQAQRVRRMADAELVRLAQATEAESANVSPFTYSCSKR